MKAVNQKPGIRKHCKSFSQIKMIGLKKEMFAILNRGRTEEIF